MQPEFKVYMEQVVKNAKVLAEELMKQGINILTGGTDNHLMLLDLRGTGITGQELENRLSTVHIITNKNAIPFDTESKMVTSGLRIGTPAVTSRGFKEPEMIIIANLIAKCCKTKEEYEQEKENIINEVEKLCKKYPLYN